MNQLINLKENYYSLRFNSSEGISGIPTDEKALDPVLTKKSIDKKEYFFMIIKNIGKFLVEKNDIKEFINTFEISQFVNLFSSKYMTSKSLLLLMKYLNMIFLQNLNINQMTKI